MKKLLLITATLLCSSVWAIDQESEKIWEDRYQDVKERKPEHLMQKIEERLEQLITMTDRKRVDPCDYFTALIPVDIKNKAFTLRVPLFWGIQIRLSRGKEDLDDIFAQKMNPFLLDLIESTTAESLNDMENKIAQNIREIQINEVFPRLIKLMGVEEYKKRAAEELASKKAKYDKKCSDLSKYDKQNAIEHEKLCAAKKLEVENVYKQRMEILAQVAARIK